MTSQDIGLSAEDAEDLQIISARLQDAVAKVKDLVYLPKSRRFAGLFNRFMWEETEKKDGARRIQAGLHFDSVLSVKSRNLRNDAPNAIVSLLAINFLPKGGEDPGGAIEFLFAGGGTIRLEVECIDAGLQDIGNERAALGRPEHQTDET